MINRRGAVKIIAAKRRSEEREMDFDLKWMQEMPERKCREEERQIWV